MHPSSQGRLRCARKFINRSGVRSSMHRFEHLKQAPSLTLITLCVQDAFSFEVYVIDKGKTSLRRSLQSLELLLHICPIRGRGFSQHLRQRAL